MRTFIALEPEPTVKLAIDAWRATSFPAHLNAVPAQNYHITIAFLGDITQASPDLFANLKPLSESLSLRANFVGHFAKSKIGFLGIEPCDAIQQLQERIYHQLPNQLTPTRQQKFVPHITLFRGLDSPLPTPLLAPDFQLHFQRFHLFESIQLKKRVSYRPLISW